jgi:hypothetical protein
MGGWAETSTSRLRAVQGVLPRNLPFSNWVGSRVKPTSPPSGCAGSAAQISRLTLGSPSFI